MRQVTTVILVSMLFLSCADKDAAEGAKDWYRPWFVDQPTESLTIPAQPAPEQFASSATTTSPDGEEEIVFEFEMDQPGSVEIQPDNAIDETADSRIVTVEVRRGETVKLYEQWSSIPTDELRALNEMENRRNLRIGQSFKLLLTPDAWRQFQDQREAHFTKLELSFFDKYDVKSLKRYTVRKGDNIWKIAKLHKSVPVWVVEKLNKNLNLARLSVGDQILIPVLRDLKDGNQSPAAKLWSKNQPHAATPDTAPFTKKRASSVAASVPQGMAVKVARNETLGHYARWGRVSLQAIIGANPGIDANRIVIGQKIRVPVSDQRLGKFYASRRRFNGTPPPKAFLKAQAALEKATRPKVAGIAQPKAAPPVAIPKANDLKQVAPAGVVAATVEKSVPEPKSPKARKAMPKKQFKKHVVSKGENAWKIATKRYGIRLIDLKNANPNVNLERLHVGAVLQIPITTTRVIKETL